MQGPKAMERVTKFLIEAQEGSFDAIFRAWPRLSRSRYA